jgi:hypothetical protein
MSAEKKFKEIFEFIYTLNYYLDKMFIIINENI